MDPRMNTTTTIPSYTRTQHASCIKQESTPTTTTTTTDGRRLSETYPKSILKNNQALTPIEAKYKKQVLVLCKDLVTGTSTSLAFYVAEETFISIDL